MHNLYAHLTRDAEDLMTNEPLCQLCTTGKLQEGEAEVVMTGFTILHNETDDPQYEAHFEITVNGEPTKQPSFIGSPLQIFKAALEEFSLISAQVNV